jgi:hypothetical protein
MQLKLLNLTVFYGQLLKVFLITTNLQSEDNCSYLDSDYVSRVAALFQLV